MWKKRLFSFTTVNICVLFKTDHSYSANFFFISINDKIEMQIRECNRRMSHSQEWVSSPDGEIIPVHIQYIIKEPRFLKG